MHEERVKQMRSRGEQTGRFAASITASHTLSKQAESQWQHSHRGDPKDESGGHGQTTLGDTQRSGEGVRQLQRTADAGRGASQVPGGAAYCGSDPVSSTHQSEEQGNTQLNPERRSKRVTGKGRLTTGFYANS